jgi:hypothetical protein
VRKLVVILVVALVIVGCQSQPAPTATPVPPTAIPPTVRPTATVGKAPNAFATGDLAVSASLRFLIVIPDAPKVDIFVESTPVANQLGYGDVSPTRFLDPDTYHVYVVPTGKTPNDKILLQYTLKLTAGEALIDVFTGSGSNFTLNQVTENLTSIPEGQVRVGFVNFASDGSTVTASDSLRTFGNLAQVGAATAPATFDSGLHDFTIGKTKLSLNLVPQNDYLFFAIGSAPYTIVTVQAVTPIETQVRVINVTNLTLDVILDTGRVMAKGLKPRTATDWIRLPVHGYTITIYNSQMGSPLSTPPATTTPPPTRTASPTPTLSSDAATDESGPSTLPAATYDPGMSQGSVGVTPLMSTGISLTPKTTIDLVFYGPGEQLQELTYNENLTRLAPGSTRVTFLNLLSGQQSFTVDGLVTDRPVLPGTASLSVDIPPLNNAQIRIRATSGTPNVQDDQGITFAEGTTYLYLVTQIGSTTPSFLLSTEIGTATPTPIATAGG